MMAQGDTRTGRLPDGTPNETHRTPRSLLGLLVRITVECPRHGCHTAILTGPFLWAMDHVRLFRDVAADYDRWVITEYTALDYVPERSFSDWDHASCT